MDKQRLIATHNELQNNSIDNSLKNSEKIAVGLSACLAGHTVRYNGGHNQSQLCLNTLMQHFSFETFCPEVAAGFSTPRPTMRLIGNPDKPILTFSNNNNIDLTEQLFKGFKSKLSTFEKLDGYILMKNSPSCGLHRVKVYQANGHPYQQRTQGLFSAALQKQYPFLPVEEEGRLHDAKLYENFVLRVYAHHNFRTEVLKKPSLHHLINFHSSYKYVLMAHSQPHYKELGRMLANAQKGTLDTTISLYFECFMEALSKPANSKNHTNTLLHILGYLKRSVHSKARQHIVDIIYKYHQGYLPLITPLTLLKHYIEQNGTHYIRAQRYLQPYPESLGLTNHL